MLSTAGCFKSNVIEADPNKTALYIRYFNAGFGDRWLTAAETRFEQMYEEISFEPGKRGVDIVIDPSDSKSDFSADMQTQRDYVYFAESFDMLSYNTAGVLEDITDAMTTPLNESYGKDAEGNPLPAYPGETLSVYEKMSQSEKDYYVLNEGGKQKIRAIPYIDCYNGTLTYDADVFETYGLYRNSSNQLGATKASGVALGVGPDGVSNTADDCMPRTYDELFELCYRYKGFIQPFVWCGNYTAYVTELANNLFLQNAGSAFVDGLLQGQGTVPDKIVGDISDLGLDSVSQTNNYNYQTESQAFTATDYKHIFGSASLFNAVDFVYQILKNNYVDKTKFVASYTNEVAQSDFYFGKENNEKDFGFLVEGTWWFNEAEKAISRYETNNDLGKDRYTRNVSYMPLPKADEATFNRTIGENVVASNYITAIAVRKGLNAVQKLVAETFVRFYCTNESLAEYNRIVSQPRGLNYTLTPTQYNSLTPYAQSLYNIKTGSNGYNTFKVKFLRSSSDFYRNNYSLFDLGFMSSQPAGFAKFSEIAPAFKDYPSLDAIKYYSGILATY